MVGFFLLILCSCCVTLWIRRYMPWLLRCPCRRAPAQAVSPMANWTAEMLMRPPKAISQVDHVAICQLLAEMGSDFKGEGEIFICYDSGHRADDVGGAGPGIYYAAAILKLLYEQGLSCFLPIPGKLSEDAFLKKLRLTKTASNRVFIVLETHALFKCRRKLEEIYTAQAKGIELMALRFEQNLPDIGHRWAQIGDKDKFGMKQLTSVEQHFCLLPVIPPPPLTVPDDPDSIQILVVDLRYRLLLTDSVASQYTLFRASRIERENDEDADIAVRSWSAPQLASRTEQDDDAGDSPVDIERRPSTLSSSSEPVRGFRKKRASRQGTVTASTTKDENEHRDSSAFVASTSLPALGVRKQRRSRQVPNLVAEEREGKSERRLSTFSVSSSESGLRRPQEEEADFDISQSLPVGSMLGRASSSRVAGRTSRQSRQSNGGVNAPQKRSSRRADTNLKSRPAAPTKEDLSTSEQMPRVSKIVDESEILMLSDVVGRRVTSPREQEIGKPMQKKRTTRESRRNTNRRSATRRIYEA